MIPQLVAAAMPVLGELFDRAFPNSAEREKAKMEYEGKLIAAISAIDVAQMEVNKVEAAHPSIFVAGWRPFCGWVGGIGLAYHAIMQPFLLFLAALAGEKIDLPVFDTQILIVVLTGMLGLGTMRSFEKYQEVDTKVVLPWLKRNKDK